MLPLIRDSIRADAELVAFRIEQRDPTKFGLDELAVSDKRSTERSQPLDLGIDVLDNEIQMNPVFHRLWFWNTLQHELRS